METTSVTAVSLALTVLVFVGCSILQLSDSKRDQKDAADEARRLFTKPFLAAQLKYYDIPFRPSHKRDELLLLLQNAVNQGKV